MSSTADVFFKATLVGVGGTILLDLYALMMSRILGVPATNWAMVAAFDVEGERCIYNQLTTGGRSD